MPNGYHGRILHVDLSKGILTVERPDDAFYRKYMGGSAQGTFYALNRIKPGTEALSPDNVLTFSLSPLTGAPFHGQSRATVNAMSPLTGAIGDAQAGGFWPAECKFTGFDGIVIEGQSPQPVYLWMNNGNAELRDASHLWGKETGETVNAIRTEMADRHIEVAAIGPAGERMVRLASIMSMANRAFGRTGMGAVMGSKKLKAIAVRGNQRPALHNRERVLELARWGREHLQDLGRLGKLGTAAAVRGQNMDGGLPTHNFTSGVFAQVDAVSGQTMSDTILVGRDSCYSCGVRCKRVVEVQDAPYNVNRQYGGPEYETIATVGTCCDIGHLKAIAKANQLCNSYGVDTISAGTTIAWAMEAFERGMLSLDDTDGIEMRFGNADAMLAALQALVTRTGQFGNLLAEGSARAAAIVGRGSEEFLVTVKGQEAPAHMPQVKHSLGLIYAVNPFGPDHQSTEHDPCYEPGGAKIWLDRLAMLGLTKPQKVDVLNREKVEFVIKTQFFYSVLDTLCLCQFDWGPAWQLYGPDHLIDCVNAVTGWDTTLDELMTVGERRVTMMRAFNAREGIGRAADKLPPRLYVKLPEGPSAGMQITPQEIELAKDMYYEMMQWNVQTGYPTRTLLAKLGLEWIDSPNMES